jgi:hypothetical protein
MFLTDHWVLIGTWPIVPAPGAQAGSRPLLSASPHPDTLVMIVAGADIKSFSLPAQKG